MISILYTQLLRCTLFMSITILETSIVQISAVIKHLFFSTQSQAYSLAIIALGLRAHCVAEPRSCRSRTPRHCPNRCPGGPGKLGGSSQKAWNTLKDGANMLNKCSNMMNKWLKHVEITNQTLLKMFFNIHNSQVYRSFFNRKIGRESTRGLPSKRGQHHQ